MLTTRGLGPSSALCTFGLGPYVVIAVEVEDVAGVGGGKAQFEVAAHKIWIRKKKGPPTFRAKDVFVPVERAPVPDKVLLRIEGEEYAILEGKPPTAFQALKLLPKAELEKRIDMARKELAVGRKAARKALVTRAIKEIRAAERLRRELFADDEEFLLLVMMADDD